MTKQILLTIHLLVSLLYILSNFLITFFEKDSDVQQLINAAIEVRKNSYSPYSKFAVGAAFKTITGEIITGCNVENGAYGPSVSFLVFLHCLKLLKQRLTF